MSYDYSSLSPSFDSLLERVREAHVTEVSGLQAELRKLLSTDGNSHGIGYIRNHKEGVGGKVSGGSIGLQLANQVRVGTSHSHLFSPEGRPDENPSKALVSNGILGKSVDTDAWTVPSDNLINSDDAELHAADEYASTWTPPESMLENGAADDGTPWVNTLTHSSTSGSIENSVHPRAKKSHGSLDRRTLGNFFVEREHSIVQHSAIHGGVSIRWRMRNLLRSPGFEAGFAAIIAMNAAVMASELQYEGIHLGRKLGYDGYADFGGRSEAAEIIFASIDWIFGGIFAIEVVFKMAALSLRFFCDLWNVIDALVVISFALEKLPGGAVPVDAQWVRLLRLMRLGRLVRLVRTIEAFDSLYLMTAAIKGSVSSLLWALVLLFIVHVTLGLVISQALHATYFANMSDPGQDELKIFAYFGTWTRTMISMFELTLANWPPICRMLSEEVTQWLGLYCLMHKLTIGFAVVGVINGVFMQETFNVISSDDAVMMRRTKKRKAKHREKMKRLFEHLDKSNDGSICLSEFLRLAEYEDVQMWLASMELEADDLPNLFSLVDVDGNGEITCDEMIHNIGRLKGFARSIDLKNLSRAIELYHQHTAPDLCKEYEDAKMTMAPSST